MTSDDVPSRAARSACPECGKPATQASKPFCSERCRNIDLHRWLSSSYAIPAVEQDDSPEAQEGRE